MTASIGDEYQSLWGSGITQNILFLYQLLSKSDVVENVYLLDLTQDDHTPQRSLEIAHKNYTCINKEMAIQNVDILIEVGTQIWHDLAKVMQAKGAKVISLRCGNAYIDEVMGIFSDRSPLIPMNNVQYDEIWVIPHYAKNSAPMLETLYQCPVKVVNYIWEPEFVELTAARLQLDYQYTPDNIQAKDYTGQRIAICEPNLNPTKTFHVPLLICEEAYRKKPESIGHVYNMNTWRLNSNPSLLHFVNRLNVFLHNKCTFETRLDIVSTMKNTAQFLVSHHWENALNYLCLDVLYGGYALIHNSEFMKDYGYYYETFNVQDGARQLAYAIENHDRHLKEYKQNNKSLFQRYSLHQPKNIQHYGNLLLELYAHNNNENKSNVYS